MSLLNRGKQLTKTGFRSVSIPTTDNLDADTIYDTIKPEPMSSS